MTPDQPEPEVAEELAPVPEEVAPLDEQTEELVELPKVEVPLPVVRPEARKPDAPKKRVEKAERKPEKNDSNRRRQGRDTSRGEAAANSVKCGDGKAGGKVANES